MQIIVLFIYFIDFFNIINYYWIKVLLVSLDGSKLYVGVGFNSNIIENGLVVEYCCVDVLEVDVVIGVSCIYVLGLCNFIGLQWELQIGKLWVIVNECDEIGLDLVLDYMILVKEGVFYGWFYSYWGQYVDFCVKLQCLDLVKKVIKLDYVIGLYVVLLGFLMMQGNVFFVQYYNGVFIGEYGSWDCKLFSGYQVVFVVFLQGSLVGKLQLVVIGFYFFDELELYGVLVGLMQDVSGVLLIVDDVGNVVWWVILVFVL